jgi:hypothetical protein
MWPPLRRPHHTAGQTRMKRYLKTPSKARYRHWKVFQNAHILRVCSASETLSALLSGLMRSIQIASENRVNFIHSFINLPQPDRFLPASNFSSRPHSIQSIYICYDTKWLPVNPQNIAPMACGMLYRYSKGKTIEFLIQKEVIK